MSYTAETLGNYETRFNPVHKAIATLERQYSDTTELLSHIDRARDLIGGPRVKTIRQLLDGLSEELVCCGILLQGRLKSLSPAFAHSSSTESSPQTFWRLFRTDGSDCAGHLEALLSGYVHYARATSDSMTYLEMLGDTESVKTLKKIFAIADKGIWFIELYMEGLALHMDTTQLPKFTPAVGNPPADYPGMA